MLQKALWVLVCESLALGCAGSNPAPESSTQQGQSYREALDLFCNVDRRAGLSEASDPILIEQQRADWLTEQLEHPDAIELKTLLTVQPPAERARMLTEEAQSVGLNRCPLADAWAREGRDS